MMDLGPPDLKRPRLAGPSSGSWQTSQDARHLPPPSLPTLPPPSFPQHGLPSSYTRPPDPQPHLADRRPQEHSPQQHWEDHRRPSSGPSHGYQGGHAPPPPSFGPPRETMVKRDPSEDTPQHQYRPNSTGNGPDQNVNAPHHEGPVRTFHPPYDPAQNRPQPYPSFPHGPHSPMSAPEPYSHPVYGTSGLPPPRDPRDQYASVSYPPNQTPRPSSEQVRKKAQRAAQACDSCRGLKAKCDEGRPSCSSCIEKHAICRYRDPPAKPPDKASADIMDGIARMENGFNRMDAKFDYFTKRMDEMEKVQRVILQNLPNAEARLKEEVPESVPMLSMPSYHRPSVGAESQVLTSNESPYGSTPGYQRVPERFEQPLERFEITQQRPGEEEAEEEDDEGGGDPGPPKDSSIPINHTTGANRLLLSKSIADMCRDFPNQKMRIRYPMEQETKRGMLRLYGRGEGGDVSAPGYEKDPFRDRGADNTGDAHSPPVVSTPPAGEEWGQLSGLTPPVGSPGSSAQPMARGAIGADGMPDYSRERVEPLVKSYMECMNIMHPILTPGHLKGLVETFLKWIPEKSKNVTASSHESKPFVEHRYTEYSGAKRKRSPIPGDHPEPHTTWDLKPNHPFRTINTAIVLLVMALGAICEYKEKLPDIAPDINPTTPDAVNSRNASPVMRNGHPLSPLHRSPSLATPVGIASPPDMSRTQSRSRKMSTEGRLGVPSVQAPPRNLDAVPGLPYFAFATDILGNQLGGQSLSHVHAFILAGLYHGQLARVMESSAYINNACRILQILLRPKLDRFKKVTESGGVVEPHDNPLIFAFWTCLQLESDIVAELPYPYSGILTYEEDMPGPNLKAANDDGLDPLVIESYSAQLFLRKHLNSLHNMFYRPNKNLGLEVLAGKQPDHFPTVEAAQINISKIKKVAPNMEWDIEKGEPADHILHARLRAKYYGAEVITYHLFVLDILEMESTPSNSVEQAADAFVPSVGAPRIGRNAKRIEDIPGNVLEYALCGLRARINSTRAFHGLGDPGKDRLIVTNVWGTAHAQWGNLLVLQAAWKNPILRTLLEQLNVTEDSIKLLVEQTIAFLDMVATPKSALRTDLRLLIKAGISNGFLPHSLPQGPNTSSSFSSTTTDARFGGY